MQLQEGKIKHRSSSLVFVETRNTFHLELKDYCKSPPRILPTFQTFKFTSETAICFQTKRKLFACLFLKLIVADTRGGGTSRFRWTGTLPRLQEVGGLRIRFCYISIIPLRVKHGRKSKKMSLNWIFALRAQYESGWVNKCQTWNLNKYVSNTFMPKWDMKCWLSS